MSNGVSDRPCQKFAGDLFTVKGKYYLVTVDHYSNNWELDKVDNTNVVTIIRHHEKSTKESAVSGSATPGETPSSNAGATTPLRSPARCMVNNRPLSNHKAGCNTTRPGRILKELAYLRTLKDDFLLGEDRHCLTLRLYLFSCLLPII